MLLDEKALAVRVKVQLRKRLAQLRSSIPAASIEARSARIVERVLALPVWQQAERVALFSPMREKHEVDISALDAAARAANKRVAYPFMRPTQDGFSTGFAWTDDAQGLKNLGRGFPEPPWTAPAAKSAELDLILVSALGVAPTGHRVGFGRGWYDATLLEFKPKASLIVVAFEFQLLVELPVEAHDVACDYVVTDEQVIVPAT